MPFIKGTSGNPNGRPKGTGRSQEIRKQILCKTVILGFLGLPAMPDL